MQMIRFRCDKKILFGYVLRAARCANSFLLGGYFAYLSCRRTVDGSSFGLRVKSLSVEFFTIGK